MLPAREPTISCTPGAIGTGTRGLQTHGARPAIQASGLTKRYGEHAALVGVSLTVREGEIRGLIGVNGAGKTTLMSMLAGLVRPDSGTVKIAGIDAATQPQRARSSLGYAPQDLGVYATLSVAQNLRFPCELVGMKSTDIDVRVESIGGTLDLLPLLRRPAQLLSGGEQRRLHVAMALMHRPPVLLLDEPTTGVDVSTREELLSTIRALAETGVAVCYSTHYLSELEQLGASVTILDAGEVAAEGTIEQLVALHARPGVRLAFAGAAPAERFGRDAEVDGATVTLRCHDPEHAAPEILSTLGPDLTRLVSFEVVRPTLENVFLKVTAARPGTTEAMACA